MNVLIVDDDKFVTSALKAILEASGNVTVPATGTDGSEAIKLYEEYKPDILLTDIQMNGLSGLGATEKILEKYPDAKILLLTTFLDDEYIIQALKLGAKGYLLKQNYESILPALEAVYSGQNVFGTEIISKIPGLLNTASRFDYSSYDINERELKVIELTADGSIFILSSERYILYRDAGAVERHKQNRRYGVCSVEGGYALQLCSSRQPRSRRR